MISCSNSSSRFPLPEKPRQKQKDLEQMRKFREMVTKPHRHHRTKTEEKDGIDKILPHETNLYDYPMTSTRGNLRIYMYFPL